jgi:hypothetical protein
VPGEGAGGICRHVSLTHIGRHSQRTRKIYVIYVRAKSLLSSFDERTPSTLTQYRIHQLLIWGFPRVMDASLHEEAISAWIFELVRITQLSGSH